MLACGEVTRYYPTLSPWRNVGRWGISNDLPCSPGRFLPDVKILSLVRHCVSILGNNRHRVGSGFYREVAANHDVADIPFHISERIPAEQTVQECRNGRFPLHHRRARTE